MFLKRLFLVIFALVKLLPVGNLTLQNSVA